MVTSSRSSDYDYEYSSSSSEEDFKVPEMKTSTTESHAKRDHSAEIKYDVPPINRRITQEELLKRKVEDDMLDDRQKRRDRIQRRISAAEENLQSRAEGVASDSDASEDEPVWVPAERKIKPDLRTREIERLVQDDLEAEREEEDYWEDYELDIHPDFVNNPDNDSDEELEEDFAKDDDDESDNSDDSDESDN
ncbi:coiled-coil domain-containing protein 1-like [Papaver somniferum]|uniref:coiled-coil domain-containing protein 1-like n=1 Tax=Papaver somniferum TaxID=3469 RepID=UPI000E700C0A|nr:coiled-coil domain-containing protein 1-like [Papaver somniferum]